MTIHLSLCWLWSELCWLWSDSGVPPHHTTEWRCGQDACFGASGGGCGVAAVEPQLPARSPTVICRGATGAGCGRLERYGLMMPLAWPIRASSTTWPEAPGQGPIVAVPSVVAGSQRGFAVLAQLLRDALWASGHQSAQDCFVNRCGQAIDDARYAEAGLRRRRP